LSLRVTIAAVTATALALLLGGCAAYDYLQHSDRIAYRAGDAVKANLERETIDPSSRSMYDVGGLGKNGSVVPADPDPSGKDAPSPSTVLQ
jgi:hypothetical protein